MLAYVLYSKYNLRSGKVAAERKILMQTTIMNPGRKRVCRWKDNTKAANKVEAENEQSVKD